MEHLGDRGRRPVVADRHAHARVPTPASDDAASRRRRGRDLRAGQADPWGRTRGDGSRRRLARYRTWPVSKRVEFFARTGVAWAELRRRLIEKDMVDIRVGSKHHGAFTMDSLREQREADVFLKLPGPL